METVGQPGVGGRRPALRGRRRAVPPPVHSAVQCDQSDVAGDEAGCKEQRLWGGGGVVGEGRHRAFNAL